MQRNSILCPNCGLLISLSEQSCPYCGLRTPGARWRRLAVFRLLADPALLVKTVIGVNIGIFVLSLVRDPRMTGMEFNPLLLLSPADSSLFVLGATGTIPIDSYHRWWTLVGGSLGAQVLNETVPVALARIAAGVRPQVVHQCGAKNVTSVQAAYRSVGVEAEIVPFIDDIARRYAEADVVLCRAGAITVTELAAAGVAGILVPLVVSTTQHQRTNAEFMAGKGAALHLPQSELTAERLATLLEGLTRPRLLAMANARALGRPDATATVAAVIEKVAA